jgi:S-adenosyl methyltransferase
VSDEEADFCWGAAEKDLMAGIDASVPHSARIWNYWLGGKDNFPVDRVAGDEYIQTFPGILDIARLTRQFLIRAVRYLAEDAGIRQFLDVGTGLPTVDNTHEIAQRVAPEARIVYVDNDPLVLVHAQALLTGTAQGVTDYIHADMREPATILEAAKRTLNLTQPVALTLMGVLGHITDDDEAQAVVRRMMEGLPSGSYLAIADGADEITSEFEAAQRSYDEGGSVPYKLRSQRQIARFFAGLELLEPGIVPVPQWRPEVTPITPPPGVQPLAAIVRKP